ncbi:MAG: hypothetical protein A2252_08850 [Elusimicrobia bacterium RIFOXYA2_FULL_39_19]|nr:MAG: hypothetical protein A2252_08850 [Elusimicrobia bacterium RIFOXYA2_FULL_39_19]
MLLAENTINILLQANRTLSSTLKTEEVLSKIMEYALKIVPAQAASILLLDEKTNKLIFDVVLGGGKVKQLKQIQMEIGEGIAGWVAKEQKPLIVNNVAQDKRWARQVDQLSEFETKSLIAVPLLFKNKLLGVIELINRNDSSDFTQEDCSILEAFSAQAAISIETARLFAGLNTEKEKFELIFSQMTDAAIFTDPNGNIIFCNQTCSCVLGQPCGDIFSTFSEYISTPPLKEAYTSAENTLKIDFENKNRQLFFSGKLNRIFSNGSAIGYMLIFRDVTDEKKEQLQKRNFLSLISHKLKTPLVPIIGYSEILMQKFENDPQNKHFLEIINTQGQHLDLLVNKLLDFTIIESGQQKLEKAPMRFDSVLKMAIFKLQDYLFNNKTVLVINPGIADSETVLADVSLISVVVKNLIENAVKFNPNTDKNVQVSLYETEGMTGLCIKDNGPGIPQEQQNKLFQGFYQVEESFTGQIKGMGIGLATCKIIIETHKGKIGINKSDKNGSEFYFVLPKQAGDR